jgi:hypothetical protein
MARLTRQEALEILEEIARDSNNSAARIAAIKELLSMNGYQSSGESAFDQLDELASRRRTKKG